MAVKIRVLNLTVSFGLNRDNFAQRFWCGNFPDQWHMSAGFGWAYLFVSYYK